MLHPTWTVMKRFLLVTALCIVSTLALTGAPALDAAPLSVVPERFVSDRVDNIALRGTKLFWKSTCGASPLPDRSRIRSVPGRGSGGQGQWSTLFFPADCRSNRVASANIAVDDNYVYWLTMNGRIARLADTAGVGDSPAVLGRTTLTPINTSCCSIAVDDTFLFWNERNKIYRMPKGGGDIALMFDYPSNVRDLRARNGVLFFLDAQAHLRIVEGADASNFIWFPIADHVASYSLNGTRVFWITRGGNNYAIFSTTYPGTSGAHLEFSSPNGTELQPDALAVDDRRIYWHEVRNGTPGAIFALPIGSNVPRRLTDDLQLDPPLLSDGRYLFFPETSSGIYRLPVECAGTSAVGDICITGIEVTQAIQTPANEIPLVGDKTTVVRVYVRAQNDSAGPWSNVTARLDIVGSGVTHTPALRPTLTVPTDGSNRRALDDSFTFLLNANETAPGTRSIHVRIYSTSARREADTANNEVTQTVTFQAPQTLSVYGFTYANRNSVNCPAGFAPDGYMPPYANFEAHRRYVENVHPLSTLVIRPLPGNPVLPPNIDNHECTRTGRGQYVDAKAWLQGQLDRMPTPGNWGYLLQPENFRYAGAGCPGGVNNFVSNGQDLRSDPGPTMAQEIAHCYYGPLTYHTFTPGSPYPRPDGTIGAQVGVKTTPPFQTFPGYTANGQPQTYDIMSYSNPAWVSPFTYCNLIDAEYHSAVRCSAGVNQEASVYPPPQAPEGSGA